MVASQEFVLGQEKGEFVPKVLRSNRVKEVRSSHFTLGYEPSVLTSSKEANQQANEDKWDVKRNVKKGGHGLNGKQHFNLNMGSQVFHG